MRCILDLPVFLDSRGVWSTWWKLTYTLMRSCELEKSAGDDNNLFKPLSFNNCNNEPAAHTLPSLRCYRVQLSVLLWSGQDCTLHHPHALQCHNPRGFNPVSTSPRIWVVAQLFRRDCRIGDTIFDQEIATSSGSGHMFSHGAEIGGMHWADFSLM